MKIDLYLSPADNLQKCVNSAPKGAFVHLAPGIYRQKLEITAPGITILGAGQNETILVYNDYARKPMELGRDCNTFRSYTAAVLAPDVHIENLAIVNDALQPEVKGQEIALTVYGDNFTMRNCRLSSTQDTLFLGPLPPNLIDRYEHFLMPALRGGAVLRQRFENCLIEGTVDFIFGCGNALFDSCEIRSLKDARKIGYVAAPSHRLRQAEGMVFRRCDFTRAEGVADESVFLARPWRDYGLAKFIDCTYGLHITAEGFDKWQGTHRDRTARFYEVPLRPGRVPWARTE